MPIVGLAVALWSFLIYHSTIALFPPAAQERFLTIVSPATGTTLFFAILVIHVAEATAALVACSWAEMPPQITLQFVVTVFFVGVPWFRECLRAAYHRRRELDDSETIKIR